MKNGIVMLGANRAKINLLAQIPARQPDEKSLKTLSAASLGWMESNHGKAQDSVQVPMPQLEENRYVYKDFRALSQVFLSNRGLDFSRPGVLEASVGLLKGKTVYANHDFRDIDNWRGVIAASYWDAEGKDAGGVPGINVQTMVDAFLNYRTACGLMMNPPAINSASVTVVSEVEFSHLDLVKDGTFWNYFLEEVNGEIVRLIATKIVEFWEMSFVFMGEDRLAKNLPSDADGTDAMDENLQAEETRRRQGLQSGQPALEARQLPASKLNATEKKMKVTQEQRTVLGINVEGDDVPEQTVLDAALSIATKQKDFDPVKIAELSAAAKQGETLSTLR